MPTSVSQVLGNTTKKKPTPKQTTSPFEILGEEKEEEILAPGIVLGSKNEDNNEEELDEATKSGFFLTQGAVLSWVLTLSGLFFLAAAGIPILKKHFTPVPERKKRSVRGLDSGESPNDEII